MVKCSLTLDELWIRSGNEAAISESPMWPGLLQYGNLFHIYISPALNSLFGEYQESMNNIFFISLFIYLSSIFLHCVPKK